MEENRPFMPPPPPKMPPRPDMAGQSTVQPQVGEAPVQPVQSHVSQSEISSAEQSILQQQPAPKVEGVDRVQSQGEQQVEQTNESTKKEKKEKKAGEKKTAPLATALYWIGFVVCLVGIGLCIYFLVK